MHPKLEDKTVISRFVINCFSPDKSQFTPRFSRYTDPFETEAKAKITACEAIVATSFYINQKSTVTKTLMATAMSVRTNLDDIELMAENAGINLNMDWKKMGFSEVRQCISRKNMEGMPVALTTLNKNIDDNKTVLANEGLKDTEWDDLKAKLEQVRLMNEKQNKMEGDKESAVAANHVLFDDMWNTTLNICKAGKVIFKGTVRAKEYTVSVLLKRIRHDGTSKAEKEQKLAEQLAANIGELDLTAKDFGLEDSWVEDAEVEIVGTDIKLPTDDEGGLLLDLKAGSYVAIIRKPTYEEVEINFEIKAGETTEVVVEMKAVPE